jgi:hypothetical protein
MTTFQWHLMLHLFTKLDKTYHYNSLIFDHTPVWFVSADWHHNNRGTGLKRLTQAAFNCQNLIVYDGHFELTVEIFSGWIKGQDLYRGPRFVLNKDKNIPLPPPLNRGGVHALREKKFGSKVDKKTYPFPVSFIWHYHSSSSLPSWLQHL